MIAGMIEFAAIAHVVTRTDDGLDATTVPLLWVGHGDDASGSLIGHVARANPMWRTADGAAALAIFAGPDAYISPSWYPAKREHGRVVPTWNYESVLVHGRLTVHDDDAWKLGLVRRLTDHHERDRARTVVGRRRANGLHRQAAQSDRRHRARDRPHRGQAQAESEPRTKPTSTAPSPASKPDHPREHAVAELMRRV